MEYLGEGGKIDLSTLKSNMKPQVNVNIFKMQLENIKAIYINRLLKFIDLIAPKKKKKQMLA
jgi:hypothetical protein